MVLMLKRLIFLAAALLALAGLALAAPCVSVTGATYAVGYTCTVGDKQFTLGSDGNTIPDAAVLSFTEDLGRWTVSLSDAEALPNLSFTYTIQVLDPGKHIDSVLADFIVSDVVGTPSYTKTLQSGDGDTIGTLSVSIGHRPVVQTGLNVTYLVVTDTYVASGGQIIGLDNVFHQASNVPEPASFLLFGGAIALLGIGRRLW
jgi:hypothetical protein